MENVNDSSQRAKVLWNGIVDKARQVITDPAGFFRGMPKTGGFVEPLLFMVATGLLAGIIRAVLGLIHVGPNLPFWLAVKVLVLTPIFVIVGGFIVAGILFVIWKFMGSGENYETAYRCTAYTSAVAPVTAVLGLIPYVGSLVPLAWGLYLLVTASVEVHKIVAKTAWLVFGILAGLLAIGSISTQIKVRRWAKSMEAWQHDPAQPMTPEQAGRVAAEFMKAMQDQAQRNAADRSSEE